MKRQRKKEKSVFLHVYGILDKVKRDITKVSLDKEEILFEIEMDNHDQNFSLCDFEVRIKVP